MKKILSLAFLTLSAGAALAADLPSQKGPPMLPPPPPPPLWTGFFVGLNAGGTWSASNNVHTIAYPGACNAFACPGTSFYYAGLATGSAGGSSSGFIGGGQIGYNWQFFNSFVGGVEADIQGVASSQSDGSFWNGADVFGVGTFGSMIRTSRSLDYIGTVRGRLGWLFTPTLMVYGTGGLAYGGVTVNSGVSQYVLAPPGLAASVLPSFGSGAFADTRVGWTVGGGLEWLFWPNWSAKVEYLYYDLGSVNYSISPLVANTVFLPPIDLFGSIYPSSSTRFDGHIVRAGLNYHFNWGAPAPTVAKY